MIRIYWIFLDLIFPYTKPIIAPIMKVGIMSMIGSINASSKEQDFIITNALHSPVNACCKNINKGTISNIIPPFFQ